MIDYLLQLCLEKDIELFYTNNSEPVLSSYLQYGVRNIIAYNVFRECPEEIAYAVVDYYTNEKDREINFNKIKEFLMKHFKSVPFKIDSIEIIPYEEKDKDSNTVDENMEETHSVNESKPKGRKQGSSQNAKQTKTQRKKKTQSNENMDGNNEEKPKTTKRKTNRTKNEKVQDEVKEVNIKYMTMKSFKKNEEEVNSDKSIRVEDGDVVELDITIDPFNI